MSNVFSSDIDKVKVLNNMDEVNYIITPLMAQ